MAEGDSGKPRVGDETLGRIRDLADGWAVPAATPRPKPASVPPPPPAARAKPASVPPPTPPPPTISDATLPATPRAQRASAAPPARISAPQPAAVPAFARSTLSARPPLALPRVAGVLGDVRYVGTVLVGRMRARRTLGRLSADDARARTERTQRLIAIARAAIGRDDIDVPAIDIARDELAGLEDGRSRSAGAGAAAIAERSQAQRALAEHETTATAGIAALEAQLAELVREMMPVERAQADARTRASKLAAELAEIDRKIRDCDARATSMKMADAERAAASAAGATTRADRDAVARDEPAIMARLAELAPVAAGMLDKRTELERELTRVRDDVAAARRQTASALATIDARHSVAQRAHGDAESARDDALLRLGDALATARPAELAADLRPLDALAAAAAARATTAAIQGELLASVQRGGVVRGVVWITLLALLVGVGAWAVLLR